MTQLAPNKPGKRRDYLTSYIEQDGCWIYTGSISPNGYGTILGRAAHRYFYTHLVGPIPDGMQIDHLCRVTACVNPAHLEPVTPLENARRRPDVGKTHCIRGHALSGDNVVWTMTGRKRALRPSCRTCQIEAKRRYRARQKATNS